MPTDNGTGSPMLFEFREEASSQVHWAQAMHCCNAKSLGSSLVVWQMVRIQKHQCTGSNEELTQPSYSTSEQLQNALVLIKAE